jgi:lysophospholipase L1-like esterase
MTLAVLSRSARLAAAVLSLCAVLPAGALATPECVAPPGLARFELTLPRSMQRIAAGGPLTIVAIGSSSTAGAGASSSAASYPSRLEALLRERFPTIDIRVLNRGVNGEEAADMLARFEAAVIAEKPDLVLWQVGTNSVLRDHGLEGKGELILQGLRRVRAIRADAVLIDPQFAPKVLAKTEADGMVALIGTTAKSANVDVFHRFALMRYWHDDKHIPFGEFLSADGLHMNDWSYDCVARLLSAAITDAATRNTAMAGAGRR